MSNLQLAAGQPLLPLSGIILKLNEAENLMQCLALLEGIAAEVVVVESSCQDGTFELVSAAGTRMISNTGWSDFGSQENIALQAASCQGVLALDEDERMTDQLCEEIYPAVVQAGFYSYKILGLLYLCGKPIIGRAAVIRIMCCACSSATMRVFQPILCISGRLH